MKNINFHTCTKVGNKLWFITLDGYLMSYSITEKKSEVMVLKNDYQFGHVTDNMIYYCGSIYFTKQDGSLLYEYRLSENCYYYYEMPELQMINWETFSGIYLIDDFIYFFTKTSERVIVFDTNSKKIAEERTDFLSPLNCSVKIDDSIYFSCEKKIIQYNIKEHDFVKEYNVDFYVKWMTSYDSQLYLVSADNCIYIYDMDACAELLIYNNLSKNQTISRFFITENYYYIFPSTVGDYILINKEDKNIKKIKLPQDLIYQDVSWGKYLGYFEDGNEIWLANRMCNYAVYIDKNNEEVNFYKIHDDDAGDIKRLKCKKDVISENELNLRFFLMDYI